MMPVDSKRVISSVGSEHLPYKQGVVGSNPTLPTKKAGKSMTFWLFAFCACRFYTIPVCSWEVKPPKNRQG